MTRNRVEDHSSKEAHLLVCSSCKDAWAELNEYIRIAMAALPTTTLQVLLPVLLFCGCGVAQNSAIRSRASCDQPRTYGGPRVLFIASG
jgi:hypothetical protein